MNHQVEKKTVNNNPPQRKEKKKEEKTEQKLSNVYIVYTYHLNQRIH